MNYLTFAKNFAAKNKMSFQEAVKSAKTKEAFNKKKGVKAGKKGAASKNYAWKNGFHHEKGWNEEDCQKSIRLTQGGEAKCVRVLLKFFQFYFLYDN